MKIKGFIILALTIVVIATSCTQTGIRSAKIKTEEDSLAYSVGIWSYFAYQKDSLDIDPVLIAKGMIDAKNGKNTIDESMAYGFINLYMQKRQEEMMKKQMEQLKEQYSGNIEKSANFLAENKKRDGVIETESGLQYEVIKMGKGPKPEATQSVLINYTGTLIDSTKFGSSADAGGPATMNLNGVIPGMKEGLLLMPVGSKFKLYIPYEMAYGDMARGQIPPYSTLIFDVELLEIAK